MGIFVKEGVLPKSGVKINNVYISFHKEAIYIQQVDTNSYNVWGSFRVFPDQNNKSYTEFRSEILLNLSDVSKPLYSIFYSKLKEIFPNSTDIF
jgi:hypothetical protein